MGRGGGGFWGGLHVAATCTSPALGTGLLGEGGTTGAVTVTGERKDDVAEEPDTYTVGEKRDEDRLD